MSSINTNLNSLFAQNALQASNRSLSTSIQRLSTGLRINNASDDPSGLVSSAYLSQEQAGLTQALSNVTRASAVIGTASSGINQITSLLTQIQSLVNVAANSGGLSVDEQAANQSQTDSLVSQINRVSAATTFQGKGLLNGNLDYSLSGVAAASLQNLKVNSARLAGGAAQQVTVAVTLSAQTAHTGYSGGALAGGNNVTLEIGGNTGSDQINIAGGTSVAGIIAAVNTLKSTTGTSASLSGANFRLDSIGFGSTQFVSIRAVSGVFVPTAPRATGRDAAVTINNQAASVQGTSVSLSNSNLDASLNLGAAFNVVGSSTFFVTGGGASFSVGSRVTDANKIGLGIGSVSAGNLGDAVNGYLSSLTSGGANAVSASGGANAAKAQLVISSAIKQLSTLNARVGNFLNYTLGGTAVALQTTLQNTTAAQSAITDTNFAQETANLSRQQIIQASATSVLATANSQAQSVLKLLA